MRPDSPREFGAIFNYLLTYLLTYLLLTTCNDGAAVHCWLPNLLNGDEHPPPQTFEPP